MSGKSSAFDVLRAYLSERAAFSEDDFAAVRRAFTDKRLGAGEFLQRAGDVTPHAAFVSIGVSAQLRHRRQRQEHIVQFAPETWWLADSNSLATGVPFSISSTRSMSPSCS